MATDADVCPLEVIGRIVEDSLAKMSPQDVAAAIEGARARAAAMDTRGCPYCGETHACVDRGLPVRMER